MNFKDYSRPIITDIRFWIILFFMVRLIGITNPPLETGHNWRQCFTGMVTRNFLETDANILYPRMDMSGNREGIIASEFPLFNYLIFLIAGIFGFELWYGRLINLVISSLGIWYFYRLSLFLFNKAIASNATVILLSSIWFAFSRKIMPDTFSVSLVITGLYFCYKYIMDGKAYWLILYIILSAAGVLSKLPSILYLGLLLIPLISPQVLKKRKILLLVAGILISGSGFLWYFIWVPHLISEYGNMLYIPVSLGVGIRELIDYWPGTLEKFYFTSFYSFIAFAAFLGGVLLMVRNRMKLLAGITGISFILLLVFMLKAGRIFSQHNYYIIPFTPVMALCAGYALSLLRKRWTVLILALIVLEGIANQYQDFFIKDSELYKLELEAIADLVSTRDDLIIINGGGNPQELYFSHRKGWTVNNPTLSDTSKLQGLIRDGAQYLFVNQSGFTDSLRYPVLYDGMHYRVYGLSE